MTLLNFQVTYMRYDPKSKNKVKPPTYWCEFCYITLLLLTFKLWSEEAFQAIGFFTATIPLMVYMVISLFSSLLKFIQMLHIEDVKEGSDDAVLFGLLSQK